MNDGDDHDGFVPRETKLRQMLIRPQFRPNYQVAALAALSPSRLSEYSWGRRPIPPHHLMRLCEVLECTPEEIVGFAEPLEMEEAND